MTYYKTILVEKFGEITSVILNKPELHNALDDILINELYTAFENEKTSDSRVIILTGRGKSFCAGADLKWMKGVINYTYEQNISESTRLADLLELIHNHPKPVIAKVNGPAYGGGVGIFSACDIACCSENASFALTEVRLGLVPAVISPYIIHRVNFNKAKELFISGEVISAEEAFRINLINKIISHEKLDFEVDLLARKILKNSPNAIAKVKELIEKNISLDFKDLKPYTAELISSLRISDEAQEGIKAFFEKRKPNWIKD